MIDVAVLNQERAVLRKRQQLSGTMGEATLNIRIEALKELTQDLLKQIESLRGERPGSTQARKINLQEEVRRFETDIIRYALLRTGGSQRRAARLLGVKPTTLNAKIKRYGIQPFEALEDTENAD